MLAKFLKGATASANNLRFVGGVAIANASNPTPSYSLTSLTGGLASAPAIGDIVIACITIKDSTNRDLQCTTSGYTEIIDLHTSGFSNNSQLAIYYKVLTAADTSVAFDLGVSTASRFACHVWRGINATPLDTTAESSIGNSGPPNAPPITTVSSNAVVIAVGAQAAGGVPDNIVQPTTPSGMGNFFQSFSSTTFGIAIASILLPSAGTYDPPAFGGFSTSSSNGICVATIALRSA
jgi:hypothetical protein